MSLKVNTGAAVSAQEVQDFKASMLYQAPEVSTCLLLCIFLKSLVALNSVEERLESILSQSAKTVEFKSPLSGRNVKKVALMLSRQQLNELVDLQDSREIAKNRSKKFFLCLWLANQVYQVKGKENENEGLKRIIVGCRNFF